DCVSAIVWRELAKSTTRLQARLLFCTTRSSARSRIWCVQPRHTAPCPKKNAMITDGGCAYSFALHTGRVWYRHCAVLSPADLLVHHVVGLRIRVFGDDPKQPEV